MVAAETCPHKAVALRFIALEPFVFCGDCGSRARPMIPRDPADVAFA